MLMRQLLLSIVTKFDDLYSKMLLAKTDAQQLAYAQCLQQAIALAR